MFLIIIIKLINFGIINIAFIDRKAYFSLVFKFKSKYKSLATNYSFFLLP